MLVLWRLFGLLVRERSVLKLVGANLKDGQNVLVGGWSQASSREASVALAPGPPMGAGCGVCFGRPLGCLRGCAADRVPPVRGSPRTRRGRLGVGSIGRVVKSRVLCRDF